MSLVRHSFSKSFSNYGSVIASPKVIITALLMALLPIVIIVGVSFQLLMLMYPQLAIFGMFSPIYVIFVMPFAYILQTIYVYQQIRKNDGLSSEVSGSLPKKYLKLIGYMILLVIMGIIAGVVFGAIVAAFVRNFAVIGAFSLLFGILSMYFGARLFAVPYIVIIDNEGSAISKSLELTSEYSGRIFGSMIILILINFACSYVGKLLGNSNMMTTIGISFMFGIFTMLFFNTFYVNMYNRLKELNGESVI